MFAWCTDEQAKPALYTSASPTFERLILLSEKSVDSHHKLK